MKIRSITFFINPASSDPNANLDRLGDFARQAVQRYQSAGIEVQTIRAATVPFGQFLDLANTKKAVLQVQEWEKRSEQAGFNYLSLGPAGMDEIAHAPIPELLAATRNVYFSGIVAIHDRGLSLAASRACGSIIARSAQITPDGFTNLRFAALMNVPSHVPFFPAAYSSGDDCAFGLAIESADLAVEAFNKAGSLDEAQRLLIRNLEAAAVQLESVADVLDREWKIGYVGSDFSLAPFPADHLSLGHALELLGPSKVGAFGSLAAAALIADCLNRGKWKKTGFNGLMLPVLEDSVLARRTIEGSYSVKDLLLYSAVCGTGLDTVPLPGDSSPDTLSALILDIAALSLRLDKPLTARLMPIPGKKAGEMTNFNFPYFANGRVLDLPAEHSTRLFQSDETFFIHPRS